jgi:hypothetical protein
MENFWPFLSLEIQQSLSNFILGQKQASLIFNWTDCILFFYHIYEGLEKPPY